MKIKEIKITANVAWSPKQNHPIYLAAGTAAQQLDATFSTTASVDIYHVNLESQELEMPIVGTLPCEHRFNNLLWSDCGMDTEQHPSGLIMGGSANGELIVLNANSILSGRKTDAIVHTFKEHTGSINALDINQLHSNLVLSGGPDSEIFIWDLNKPGKPVVPGPKSTPPDQISCVAWNKQVSHILSSSSHVGRVVVWDLRKSEAIIKVGDQSAMFHYKSMAWHPDIATQILIANEDDRYPIIQMWDLRFATSPMKIMEGHTRGVLSLAWSPEDSDLLMSCGKDNRILCWNPNSLPQSGEIVYELPSTSQWTADVSWCPRNPGIVSTTAFDGHVTVSTLMGGSQEVQQQQQQNQISDAFGIQQDAFTPHPQQPAATLRIEPLKKPPKWMRKPCAARFGFGGKLVSFGNVNEQGVPKQVFVSQVITETELIDRSRELENSLLSGQLQEYCDLKVVNASNEHEKTLWQFLKSNLSTDARMQFLNLLGYNPKELAQKISTLNSDRQSTLADSSGVNPDELARKIENLKTGEQKSGEKLFESVSPFAGDKTPASESEGSALFDAIAASSSNPQDMTEEAIEPIARTMEPFSIPTDDDADGLICQALLTGNFEGAVDVCFGENRMADGLLLAISGGPDLFSRTQKRYFAQTKSGVSNIISSVVNRDWRNVVEYSKIVDWKESLCILVTYGKAEEFSELCCVLGERLENELEDFNSALICYICAGDVERMVSCWTRSELGKDSSPNTLQSLIEKVMVLKRSVENTRSIMTDNTHLAEQLCNYAHLLSSQGSLQTAMMYLSTVNHQSVTVLKDRVFRAHGQMQGYAPECPFQRLDIRPQQQNINKLPPQTKSNKNTFNNEYPGNTRSPTTNSNYSPTPGGQYLPPTDMNNTGYYIPSAPNTMRPTQPPQLPNMYTPPPTQPNLQPSVMQPFNPMANSNNPSTLHDPAYNLAINGGMYSGPAPPTPNINNPSYNNIMVPGPPPSADVGPPPPSDGNQPISMRKAKQEMSPSAHLQPNQPMNFYNPMANATPDSRSMQPNMNMQPPSMPNPSPSHPPGLPTPGVIPSGNNRLPPGQQQPSQMLKKTSEPAQPEVVKGPIPSEHIALQQTFDAIVERCRNASNNPQAKRKLEDVRRRLEILYDLLRATKLSPNVLNGLHQMSQVCQQTDYMTGIKIHTHMISTGNFSEISSFMPGLKTMMQIANQLNV